MSEIKLGIICEGKAHPDKRVPFSPEQCVEIQKRFPHVQVIIQACGHRCFSDAEYQALGLKLSDNISACDILMGIKEVPVEQLIPHKKYLFFSHTIKKQAHNKQLLMAILKNNIQLIDYECLKDINGNRILGFGRYAGLVGSYNGLRAYGIKYHLYELKPAYLCKDKLELEKELDKVQLPNIKILITGGGRVAHGALEILNLLKIKQVSPEEYKSKHFNEVVFCQLHPEHYNIPLNKLMWNHEYFISHPEAHEAAFLQYSKYTDLYIACHFWDSKAPVFFYKQDIQSPDFKISVIADISCDINGPIPTTIRASVIEEPFYDINRKTFEEKLAFSCPDNITVMSVDNLPCELPRDASVGFGNDLLDKVLPHLLQNDEKKIITNASITNNGKLTPLYQYLSDYAAISKI